MRVRLFIAIAVSAVAAVALASIMTTLRAEGEGIAANSNKHTGKFHFNATKVSHRDQNHLNGQFAFDMSAPNHPGPRVVMRQIDEMGVIDNKASFAGPGVLRLPSNTGPQEFQGRVVVHVASNRHPDEPGDPDVLFVRFTRQGGPTFEFEGRVTHGNINVAKIVSF